MALFVAVVYVTMAVVVPIVEFVFPPSVKLIAIMAPMNAIALSAIRDRAFEYNFQFFTLV